MRKVNYSRYTPPFQRDSCEHLATVHDEKHRFEGREMPIFKEIDSDMKGAKHSPLSDKDKVAFLNEVIKHCEKHIQEISHRWLLDAIEKNKKVCIKGEAENL